MQYHNDLHLKFGGIRKPRLGNSALLAMAKEKGWLVGQPNAAGKLGGVNGRDLNYSIAEVQTWYRCTCPSASLAACCGVEWASLLLPMASRPILLARAELPVALDHTNGCRSRPSYTVRYAAQHVPYLKTGVDFWWNDEGESSYFTFYFWNLAQ